MWHNLGMDYEFRITLLEKELAHVRELQQLRGGRQDINDERLDKCQALVIETATNLSRCEAVVESLGGKLDHLTADVDRLVKLMLGQKTNGHS